MEYRIFGESHGPAIGVVLTGVPSGLALDMNAVGREMARRAPGRSGISTARREEDVPEILSGVFRGNTTGTPLCAIIRNGDTHSADYEKLRTQPRPGHGDYSGYLRYDGFNDYRGGGHFSGRLTAPLVFAGAVAKQILALRGIAVGAHIQAVDQIEEESFLNVPITSQQLKALTEKEFPTLSDEKGEEMRNRILQVKSEQDSVGGVIEGIVLGLKPGIGAPDLDLNVEGVIARHMFAIPGVKGVSFGAGFEIAKMRGSQANDGLYIRDGKIVTGTNHNGGINGGITNGMPVVFRLAIRPTPSIGLQQDTVDLSTMTQTRLIVTGRHDPCIVHRAVPVVEAAAALAVCQLLNI